MTALEYFKSDIEKHKSMYKWEFAEAYKDHCVNSITVEMIEDEFKLKEDNFNNAIFNAINTGKKWGAEWLKQKLLNNG